MKNIMLDIETLGTGNRAVLLSIGACYFDPAKNEIVEQFYQNIDPQSCVESGLTMDVSTIMWWMQQNDKARAKFTEPCVSLDQALREFSMWVMGIGEEKEIRVWGNGATFDNVLIRSAFLAWSMKAPWSFRQDACYRTLRNLYPEITQENEGTAHDALDDAKYQAKLLMKILAAMGK